MQLYSGPSAFYVSNNGLVLRCSRPDGQLTACEQIGVHELCDAEACGEVWGVVGSLYADNKHYLLLITRSTPVATYPCSQENIYHIDHVVALSLDSTTNKVQLTEGTNHMARMKNSHKKLIKFVTDKVTSVRVIDEILGLFNDNGDFYVCLGNDLTLTTQRLLSRTGRSDERFFWNRRLLGSLFDEQGAILPLAQPWVVPICQGFVRQRVVKLDEQESRLTFTLISRRSVQRAGLRYLRRGIDQDANVANFVETEVILNIFGHHLSYVQIRGSVPVFWSQRGYRYRPPLVIEKSIEESIAVFTRHMNELLAQYSSAVNVVNLVDQTGRELSLATSYLQHVLRLDSPHVNYCSFDFHSHCRALHFHKVNHLITALHKQLLNTGFCWVDKSGQMVRQQRGIMRTNCVDCLDRTNVVQCAISQAVCLLQSQKLGLVGPVDKSPDELVRALQSLWADNGDAISRQYAGTDALKGDMTRLGERRLVGMLRDGYSSASRYYLSHMRHAQRQQALDTLLGQTGLSDDLPDDEEESESIARLVYETVHFVLPDREVLVGGWALVQANNPNDHIDTVLLLTRHRVIVAMYDDESEKLVEVKVIDFEDASLLQLGAYANSTRIHLRLTTKSKEQFTWRAARTRLFNNVAIPLKSADEADEYIEAIAEQVRMTMAMVNCHVPLLQVAKLDGRPERNRRRLANILASVFGMNGETTSPSPVFEQCPEPLIDLSEDPQQHQPTTSSSLNPQTCHVRPSQSDGRLVDTATGLVSRLHSMRLPLSKSQLDLPSASLPPPSNPFSQFTPLIMHSRSSITLL